ncbi:MAG: glycosyltransferase [Myxococcota bacterium]
MSARLRVLVLTNLFPSNVDPGFAPFNRQQFAELGRIAEVEVLGVVPWRYGPYFGKGATKDVVDEERIEGLHVRHPRYPPIRGLPGLNAGLLFLSLLPDLRRRRRDFDVILGSYAYPDGCAAILLGQALKLPVVVKCHGSDLNRVPEDLPARLQMQRLLPKAERVIVVSKKLGAAVERLGVSASRVRLVYNGVDRERFAPMDKADARKRLALPPDVDIVLYVGLLADHKGTRDLLAAIPILHGRRKNVLTVFIGDGPLLPEVADYVEHRAAESGAAMAVGRVRHDEVPVWMAAADVLCLPSWDEGMPNVVREAHAIGRPVVATRVGGLPEAVFDPILGELVAPRDPAALAEALDRTLAKADQTAPESVTKAAVVPSWEESAAAVLRTLEEAARR